MAHRKWKENKLQPGTAGPGNMPGCSLVEIVLPINQAKEMSGCVAMATTYGHHMRRSLSGKWSDGAIIMGDRLRREGREEIASRS